MMLNRKSAITEQRKDYNAVLRGKLEVAFTRMLRSCFRDGLTTKCLLGQIFESRVLVWVRKDKPIRCCLQPRINVGRNALDTTL